MSKDLTAPESYVLQYLGATFDGADDYAEVVALRDDWVRAIMADEVPDFLTADDFDSVTECRAAITIAAVSAFGTIVTPLG